MTFNIDPVKYGSLAEKVKGFDAKFDEISKKQDKMEAQLNELVALANKSRGGFWMGMAAISVLASVVSFVAGLWHH